MLLNVMLTIWWISFIAWMIGVITMRIPHKIAYHLTRISFCIVVFGTVIMGVLMLISGGFIYR